MGSDDIFKRKRAERQAEQKRKANSRKSFERILIVTEGSKTEPYYFSAIKDHLRLSSADVEIIGKGKAPITIVKHSIELHKGQRDNTFDKVFCVFDRDTHPSYDEALDEINIINRRLKSEVFVAIVSNPSFEYWYLLHFTDTDA